MILFAFSEDIKKLETLILQIIFLSRFSNSPESGIGTSQPSITDDIDSYPDPEFENEYEYNEEFSAVLGTGRALYPFTGRDIFEILPLTSNIFLSFI